jgi:hypothetical protein
MFKKADLTVAEWIKFFAYCFVSGIVELSKEQWVFYVDLDRWVRETFAAIPGREDFMTLQARSDALLETRHERLSGFFKR